MSTGKLAVAGLFVMGFFGILWYFLPGIVKIVNEGEMKDIVIEALFPLLAAFFCLYMAVRIAFSRESGPYEGDS